MNKTADRNSVFQKLYKINVSDLLNFSSQNFSVLSHDCIFHAHNNLKASQLILYLSFYDAFLIYEINTKIL